MQNCASNVSKVNVNIGKYVTPADVLFELVNPNDLHLNLKVFEKDLGSLAIGQRLITYNNAHPDLKYRCEILLISKDINTDSTADDTAILKRMTKLYYPACT